MDVLLLSTYELGHQPMGLARPAAHLLASGHRVRCQDLSVEPLDESLVRWAEFVGISVPMHTATRLGARVAERVRLLNGRCHLCFYGLYASMHADTLLGPLADSVIGGEFEAPLVELVSVLDQKGTPREEGRRDVGSAVAGVMTLEADGGVFLGRQAFELPRRDLLPPLERYAHLDTGNGQKLVGYVEASRGCAHRCLHCPIPPVYGGRLRVVPQEVVLEDIRQLVAMGAEHVTLGDPDFFNGIRHSLRIVEAMHVEFPALTYDATIKVEHLLEHRHHLPTLKETGCLFIVSAAEAVQDHILENLQKGHTAADVEAALRLTAGVGVTLRPTFVPFTPWTSLDDYLGLLDFVARHGLVHRVDPVQFSIRLLVPRGSRLIGTPAMDPFLGPFDHTIFTHRWQHPDPRVDRLQEAVSGVVERAASQGVDPEATFDRTYGLALEAAGRPIAPPPKAPRFVSAPTPRLTEPWFC